KPPQRTLARNPELEARVREDPSDEARWLVLEDWVLEQEDARAEWVRLDKDDRRGDAAEARGRAAPLPFGRQHEGITRLMGNAEYRAGYVRACNFGIKRKSDLALFEALLVAPAVSVLAELDLDVESPKIRLVEILRALGGSAVAPTLRALE